MKKVLIFIAYSHADKKYLEGLTRHLSVLEREGLVRVWYDGCITAGENWDASIRRSLQEADVVLLLISAEFIASQYCYSVEMQAAIDRHKRREALVVPIIIRDSGWQELPIGELQALPEGSLPVARWRDREAAYLSIIRGIRAALAAAFDE
jgi:hypothetical protein